MSKYAIHFVAGSLLLLTACGAHIPKPVAEAQHDPAKHHASFTGDHADQLNAMWAKAQQNIATQTINLKAALESERKLEPCSLGGCITPDRRALDVWPEGVTVSTEPDLTLAQLQIENPGTRLHCKADPCGTIHAPNGATAEYCASYLLGKAVVVAQSLLYEPFGDPTVYEFENVILAQYYDVSGR